MDEVYVEKIRRILVLLTLSIGLTTITTVLCTAIVIVALS